MKTNKKSCNVLFCFHYSGINNGAVRSMVDVIETLIKKYKINAYVIYPDKKESAITYLESIGVTTLRIPFYRIDYKNNDSILARTKNLGKYVAKKSVSFFCYKRAIQFCRSNNINIIYSNTTTIDYGFILSKKIKVPHIWHIREFGKEDHDLEYRGGINSLYSKISQSSAVIYISRAIKDKYEKFIDKNVINQVIYNDISPKFINPKEQFNLKSKFLNATIIGTIQEGKRQIDAIKAVEKINKEKIKVKLHICGAPQGAYYQYLKKYIVDNKLQKQIIFDGFTKQMNSYRSKMDLCIVASSNEAFGRVTIEGMLSELLIIGADSAGTSELIQNGKNGLLYESGNFEMLSKKLLEIYTDRRKMKQLAMNGFEYAKKFTRGEAAEKIQTIIDSLVK